MKLEASMHPTTTATNNQEIPIVMDEDPTNPQKRTQEEDDHLERCTKKIKESHKS